MISSVRYRIFAAACCLTLGACASVFAAGNPRVRQRVENFELPRYDKGELVWKMVCASAEILENTDSRLVSPNLRVSPRDGNPGYTITADRGMITDQQKTVVFEKNVSLVSTAGDTLKTDSLKWDVKTETAVSDTRIEINRGTMQLSGVGLTAHAKERNFRIHSQAGMVMTKDRFSPGQKGLVTVTSKGDLTFRDGVAVFGEKPKAVSDTGTITADSMTLHIDMKTQTVKKIVGTGNVSMSSDDLKGTSQSIEWVPGGDDPGTLRVLCPGPATIRFTPASRKERK